MKNIMRLGSRLFKRNRQEKFALENEIDEIYLQLKSSGKKLVLGTLVGRSGTRWLCDIFTQHTNAVGSVERYSDAEAFLRFVTFHSLPIDVSGIIRVIKQGIIRDWENNDISLVMSPYFSHSLELLVKELNPDEIIVAITDPKFIVQSFYNKGLFKEELVYNDPKKVIGYQPQVGLKPSHFFGRVIPSGQDYIYWQRLTRLGKISWWGNKIFTDIDEQLKLLKPKNLLVFDLADADQNYDYYLSLVKYFNLERPMSEKVFKGLRKNNVNASDNNIHNWTKKEINEFTKETEDWRKLYLRYSSEFSFFNFKNKN